MTFQRRHLLLLLSVLIVLVIAFWFGRTTAPVHVETNTVAAPAGTVAASNATDDPTLLYAHNLLLRKGPHFRVYIRWIRGEMMRTNPKQNPSFDLPESFLLEIQKGVVMVKYSDLADFMNNGEMPKPPLTDIKIENHDGLLQISGMAHKGISVPVRLDGTMTPMPDGRLHYHLTKLNVLKVPMKGLFGLFHIKLDDLAPKTPIPGVQIADNDIYFDTQRLLPPPHIHGMITAVTAGPNELTVIYGGAHNDDEKLSRWHNFLRLTGGTIDFAKLTMRQADLTLIDATDDPWFDLDLVNYQAQLVYGTTHITEKAGVEMYMPDLDNLPAAAKKAAKGVSVDWLKNRKTTPPLDVPTQ